MREEDATQNPADASADTLSAAPDRSGESSLAEAATPEGEGHPIPRGRGLPALAIVGFVVAVLGSMAILIWFAVRGGHIH